MAFMPASVTSEESMIRWEVGRKGLPVVGWVPGTATGLVVISQLKVAASGESFTVERVFSDGAASHP